MIILATLKDEVVDGRGRAAGKRIRKIVVIGLDNYNVVIAEGSDPANPVGKRFFAKLTHLSNGLVEYGLDTEHARKQMIAFFKRYSGEESLGDLSWAEMDERFKVGRRCTDSSGKLQFYVNLKKRGWTDDGAEVETLEEVTAKT